MMNHKVFWLELGSVANKRLATIAQKLKAHFGEEYKFKYDSWYDREHKPNNAMKQYRHATLSRRIDNGFDFIGVEYTVHYGKLYAYCVKY